MSKKNATTKKPKTKTANRKTPTKKKELSKPAHPSTRAKAKRKALEAEAAENFDNAPRA